MEEDKQIKKLEAVLNLIEDDKAKTEEVVQAFEIVLGIIESLKTDAEQKMAQNKAETDNNLSLLFDKISTSETSIKNLFNQIKEKQTGDRVILEQQIINEVKKLESLIPKETDLTPVEQKLQEIESKIPPKIDLQPITNELLDVWDKFKEIEKMIDDLKKKWVSRPMFGGGGFSVAALNIHTIDDETPTNTGDDLNFTIANTPSPIASLKVYRNGQRLKIGATNDYTFSGRTITLLSALAAGEILSVDYRT